MKAVRLAYLDGWRGFSILAVLFGHFFPIAGINTARLGVELFFVLSGRLMADLLFRHDVELSTFFWRRVSRVWPGLLAFTLIMAVLFHGSAQNIDWADILSVLSFTLNYHAIGRGTSTVLEHIWSLCIEEWAYVSLGLLAYVFRGKGRHCILLTLIVVSALCMLNGAIQTFLLHRYYVEVYWRTDVRISSVLVSAVVFLLLADRLNQRSWVPIAAGFVGILLNVNPVPDPIKYSVGTLMLAIAVATLADLPRPLLAVLSNWAVTSLGLVSFSLYLYQQPFYANIGVAPLPVLLAGAVACGVLSFALVERPCRRFMNSQGPPWLWTGRLRRSTSA